MKGVILNELSRNILKLMYFRESIHCLYLALFKSYNVYPGLHNFAQSRYSN